MVAAIRCTFLTVNSHSISTATASDAYPCAGLGRQRVPDHCQLFGIVEPDREIAEQPVVGVGDRQLDPLGGDRAGGLLDEVDEGVRQVPGVRQSPVLETRHLRQIAVTRERRDVASRQRSDRDPIRREHERAARHATIQAWTLRCVRCRSLWCSSPGSWCRPLIDWWAVARRGGESSVGEAVHDGAARGDRATVGDIDGAGRVLLVVGAVLGLVGDVALLGDSEPAFMVGLGAFAAGHLAYGGACGVDRIRPGVGDSRRRVHGRLLGSGSPRARCPGPSRAVARCSRGRWSSMPCDHVDGGDGLGHHGVVRRDRRLRVRGERLGARPRAVRSRPRFRAAGWR